MFIVRRWFRYKNHSQRGGEYGQEVHRPDARQEGSSEGFSPGERREGGGGRRGQGGAGRRESTHGLRGRWAHLHFPRFRGRGDREGDPSVPRVGHRTGRPLPRLPVHRAGVAPGNTTTNPDPGHR